MQFCANYHQFRQAPGVLIPGFLPIINNVDDSVLASHFGHLKPIKKHVSNHLLIWTKWPMVFFDSNAFPGSETDNEILIWPLCPWSRGIVSWCGWLLHCHIIICRMSFSRCFYPRPNAQLALLSPSEYLKFGVNVTLDKCLIKVIIIPVSSVGLGDFL